MDRSRNRMTIEEYNDQYLQDALERMNRCDTQCTDLGMRPYRSDSKTITSIDWLLDNLPGVNYVLDRMVNYIFANGLTSGSEDGDARLDPWLYEQKNRTGSTNYAELRQAIRRTIVYGECGLREYEGNLYHVPVGYYGQLIDREAGIDQVVAYYVRKDRERVKEKISTEEWKNVTQYGDVVQWFDDKGYILLDPSQFLVIRNNTSQLSSESPLLSDKQRIDLLTAVYDQLNYDIRYDGPGRVFFRTKSGYASGDDNDISTGEVLNNTPGARKERLTNARKEIEVLMKQIKNSSSDSVGVLSGAFEDDYIYLPRVTKGTDFLTWLDVDTTIIAQVLGMSPTLLEVGNLHGNISVEKIIDNSMLNTIIPMREMYATQFSEFVGGIVGVDKVYFDKYDMAQIDDENEAREKMSIVLRNIATASAQSGSAEVSKLLDETAEVLRSSLYDDNDNIRTM